MSWEGASVRESAKKPFKEKRRKDLELINKYVLACFKPFIVVAHSQCLALEQLDIYN